ncbi:MAG: hypothetical protein ACMG6S_22340, partial [Byssovorax sp.]
RSDPRALAALVRRGGPRGEQAAEALFELQKGDLDALAAYIRRRGAYADRADEQLFALAQKSGEPKSYRYYLEHGKRHVDEVQSVLLPEAAYLEATKKKNDVGLLGDFVREYPDSAHAEEIKATMHSMYADALRTYQEKKPSAAGLRFVTALLAELEARADPSVIVEVGVNDGASIAAADAKLAARHGADYQPAESHFSGFSLSVLEGQLRSDLIASITSSFANGTVKPTGSRYGDDAGRPSILVTCEPVAADAFVSRREQLKLSDIRFHVDFHATVPARSQELSWKYTTPGVKGSDVPVNAAGADSDEVNRTEMAEVSYARMRTEATTQILDRIKLDL